MVIKKIDFEVFLLSICCVLFLSPYIQRTVGTIGVLIFFGFYLLLEINHILHCENYIIINVVLILFYIGILLLYSLLGLSDKGAGQTNSVFFFLSYFLIIPIYKRLDMKKSIYLVTVCIVTIFFTMYQNYRLFIRMGYRFTQKWYRFGIKEAVNAQYVSAIMLFSGVLFCEYLIKKNSPKRYFYLALTVLSFMFNIIVTQRTITTLLSLAMFVLLFTVNGNMNSKKLFRVILFSLLAILLIFGYKTILPWIADLFGSERISKRINSIITLASSRNLSDVEDSSLGVRLRLIGVSIHTVFDSIPNFLFGVGDKADNLLVGNHSYFFDEFAKFGIIGGTLSVVVVCRMMKTIQLFSSIERSDILRKLLTIIFFVMFMRSLIGAILVPSIGVVMFVFTPLMFKLTNINQRNAEEKDAI